MRISDWSSDVCSSDLIGYPAAVAYVTIKAFVSMGLWGAATIGFLRGPMTVLERVLATAAAFSLVVALPVTDEVGFAAAVGVVSLHLWRTRAQREARSEEHTSELQSLMRISYAVFCLKKKKKP